MQIQNFNIQEKMKGIWHIIFRFENKVDKAFNVNYSSILVIHLRYTAYSSDTIYNVFVLAGSYSEDSTLEIKAISRNYFE